MFLPAVAWEQFLSHFFLQLLTPISAVKSPSTTRPSLNGMMTSVPGLYSPRSPMTSVKTADKEGAED